jgi:hypothetical protein
MPILREAAKNTLEPSTLDSFGNASDILVVIPYCEQEQNRWWNSNRYWCLNRFDQFSGSAIFRTTGAIAVDKTVHGAEFFQIGINNRYRDKTYSDRGKVVLSAVTNGPNNLSNQLSPWVNGKPSCRISSYWEYYFPKPRLYVWHLNTNITDATMEQHN